MFLTMLVDFGKPHTSILKSVKCRKKTFNIFLNWFPKLFLFYNSWSPDTGIFCCLKVSCSLITINWLIFFTLSSIIIALFSLVWVLNSFSFPWYFSIVFLPFPLLLFIFFLFLLYLIKFFEYSICFLTDHLITDLYLCENLRLGFIFLLPSITASHGLFLK